MSNYETLSGVENLTRDKIKSLIGHSVLVAQDQGGCRYLQSLMSDSEFRELIFQNTSFQMSELMGDPFGNYLTQKLLESSSDSQLEHVITVIENSIFRLCKEMHGTRSIQKLIDVATTRQQYHRQLIAKFLKPKIVELSREINGNHVLVKILQSWPDADKQFIFDILKLKCQQISCHKHGCCLM